MKTIRLLTGLAVGLLAACSNVPYAQRLSDRQAAYEAAAGAPVRSFRFYNSLWSWEPLGRDQLVVYTRPQQAFLLDAGACFNLEYTNVIALTSNLGEVSVGFDKVLTGHRDLPCTITRIRPIDVKRLKAKQEEQRKINTAPRPADRAH